MLSLLVKEFRKSLSIWRSCGKEYCVFLTGGIYCMVLAEYSVCFHCCCRLTDDLAVIISASAAAAAVVVIAAVVSSVMLRRSSASKALQQPPSAEASPAAVSSRPLPMHVRFAPAHLCSPGYSAYRNACNHDNEYNARHPHPLRFHGKVHFYSDPLRRF